MNPQTNVGFAAYLLLSEEELHDVVSIDNIKTKRFESTSSSKLELQALLWAFSELSADNYKIIIYTDCQNIIGLQTRRERFEKNSYMSRAHKRIKNHELYKEFYKITDLVDCEFVKVKGHKKEALKDEIDKIFTLVDKASRNALREAPL